MTTQARHTLTVETSEEPKSGWYHGFRPAATTRYWAAIARVLLGFTFLWAFLDKNFGLQFATPNNQGWALGTGDGDPTFGFLKFGTNPEGPFASTFTGLRPGEAPDPNHWTNWLFMIGLLGIGLSLTLGVFMRIAAISGVVMLGLMYLAEAPWANTVDPKTGQGAFNNPIVDDHMIYAVVLIMLMLFEAGRTWGLGKVWESTSLVQSQPWLA
ncbi:MAG TPA: hypothetical protein VMT88_10605 [Actinomycetes bacterium]|nr:hypothetical protein [Actinomycetes bacterium]